MFPLCLLKIAFGKTETSVPVKTCKQNESNMSLKLAIEEIFAFKP